MANDRLISLDVFRGMTIAGMVLVNNPGTWSAIYGPLKHAEWHGITPTDYVFPFFLFIVGVAIPIALSKRIAAGLTRDVYYKIFTRSARIFGLGFVMSAIPFFNFAETTIPYTIKILIVLGYSAALFFYLWDKSKIALIIAGVTAGAVTVFWLAGYVVVPYNLATMRIPGVLQRIAVCYLIVSLIYLRTSWRQQAMIGTALLLGYWLLMTVIPVPGCEVTTIDDKACNLAAWLDRTILTENHIWRSAKVFDPEGILSTIPALVTCLSGVLTGAWLIRSVPRQLADEPAITGSIGNVQPPAIAGGTGTAAGLFFAGTIALAVGWCWSLLFPLNKALWTSSYVIYTTGLALLTLAACYWLIDIKQMKWWTKPFVIFGVNALALFVFSGIFARLLGMIRFAGTEAGKDISLQQWMFNNLFLSWASPINASLAYAVTFILFWLFLMWLLYRKNIFIKV
ncbi:MAG: heparan-alpha-glucosaminide N-acetyltransferase domain-containing protein [Pyrinomonadaceae bacterium]